MSIEIRVPREEELEEFFQVGNAAFSDDWPPELLEIERTLMTRDRMVTAADGGRLVGQGGAFDFDMSVPGGSLRTAGVTWIGVLPTHRRRGILTGMMSHLHRRAHQDGEPLAALWAAESVIYPRFGYGMAAPDQDFEIPRHRAIWAAPATPTGAVRLVQAGDAGAPFAAVYDNERPRRPGMVPRDSDWWKLYFTDLKDLRDGFSQLFHVVHEDATGVDGYASYQVKHGWGSPGADTIVKVVEMVTNTPGAHRALWDYCFNIDLTTLVKARHRPMDDPLPWMLADPRHLRVMTRDALWLRLVDVDAALAGRRYASADAIVFDVIDAPCPWNAGRHHLEGGPDGASCAPSDAEPDLRLDARDLAAAYLGGVEFRLLAAAGRVEECRPGALERADAMFRWRPLPWNTFVF